MATQEIVTYIDIPSVGQEFNPTAPGFGFETAGEGETNDWLTPPELVKMLGPFDLDPCGCPTSPFTHAPVTFMPPFDGLALPWHGRVFCNPPYGPHVGKWAHKLSEHGNGILLIFSRVETKAWKLIWETADSFLFPFGRIYFRRANGDKAKSGTAPSALVAYGENNSEMLRTCGLAGAYLPKAEIVGTLKASTL